MKIALGVFDGVHLGHQKVIERAHRVLTFHPHPNQGVHLLTTIPERQGLINNLDIVKFTTKLGQLTPEEFIRDFLVKKFKPSVVCVGDDYAFGYNRSGNLEMLKKFGEKYDFQIEVIKEVDYQGTPIRSSRIRHLLAESKVEEAAKLLGRNYQLSGKVVRGHGVGKTLGFPTANIQVDKNKLIPGIGVYSGEVIANNKLYPCAISIGERKTFEGHQVEVEAYILDFNENIRSKRITVFFKEYLRAQRKFSTKEELKAQITKDIDKIRG